MKVYHLDWERNHLAKADMEYDIDLIAKSTSVPDLERALMKPEPIHFEKRVEFIANFFVVDGSSDFPVSLGYPVMSDAMVNTLLEVRDFNYKRYPVVLIDDSYLDHRYDANGNLKSEVKRLDHFHLVQTLEIFAGLDYTNSIYKPMREGQLFPTVISKMVVREPQSGFPPLFRITEKRSVLFVSEQAKNALEKNNIKGCVFKAVEASAF